MGVILAEASGDNAEHDLSDGDSRLVPLEILCVLIQLISIGFNGAIICTLCRRSLLKYPSNRFVFSLCLSHLIVCILSVSIFLVTTFIPLSQTHHENPINHSLQELGAVRNSPLAEESEKSSVPVQCTGSNSGVDLAHLVMMHLNFGIAISTSITVAFISAERYITIARPMRYKSIVTARRSFYALICCWLLVALITMMPLLLFENRHPVCGTFSVPMESLATYFGVIFTVVTVFALAVMIVCYTHIFRIAKAKCQKVQIGHFTTSTVSSISSDWPSSVYSSAQGQHRFLHAGSRIESSNSLLHWVLLSNLGRHTQPLRGPHSHRRGVPLTPPATPTLPPKNAFFSEIALNSRRESDETTTTGTTSGSRNGSTSSSSSNGGNNSSSTYFIDPSRSPLFQYHLSPRKLKSRWRTYLQPNYNSPRKTIVTIMILIGAILFTQLPLSFILFTSTVETTQRWFQFYISVLFSLSAAINPVLYGFLNRSIRDQLKRLLRRKSHAEHGPSASSIRKRKRGQQQLDEMAQTSKGFLSSANHNHLQTLCRGGRTATPVGIPAIKISRKESISSEDNSSVALSATSTNSINIIGGAVTSDSGCGTSAKSKMNQVQKRLMSSPYYRTVLLKKANRSSKMNSLLPRLALPDVNVRRNSSGSIVSIRTNGVMSMMKEKVKELEEWSTSGSNKYDENNVPTNQRLTEVYVEMQTFKNYSTPDLPSTEAKTKSENADTFQENKTYVSNDNANSIEINSQNKCEGQGQLPQDDVGNDSHNSNLEQIPEESCTTNVNDNDAVSTSRVPSLDHLDAQPGPSCAESQEKQKENLEACLPAESLMGVVIDEELFPENFPRKPSQDSGADMTFSDEEEELPQPGPAIKGDLYQQPSPILLSAASLASLPATLTVLLRTGEDVVEDDERFAATSKSASSLIGPLLFIEHPSSRNQAGNLSNSQSVLYLPCSCKSSKEDIINNVVEQDSSSITTNDKSAITQKKENGVTVTITGSSNSDTQLFNPQRFCGGGVGNNKRLLQVENFHYHRHHPECEMIGINAHKSKSESDICTVNDQATNRHNNSNDNSSELKVRSNCQIDYLVVGTPKSNSNSSLPAFINNESNPKITNAFTLLRSCSHNHVCQQQRGISSSCSPVWMSKEQLVGSNSCENDISQIHLLTSSAQSPQWLSVMSIHSDCSSLSSTCPLRILDGNNKSDVSDYEDFEDHIEI